MYHEFIMHFLFLGGLVPAVAPHGDIIFKNVTFAYPSRENSFICKNLSLHVPSSSITAIVGSSGSGKSTLAYLLLRLYDPLEGQILLDGTEVKLYDPCYLRSIIGTVSQVSSSIRKYFYLLLPPFFLNFSFLLQKSHESFSSPSIY